MSLTGMELDCVGQHCVASDQCISLGRTDQRVEDGLQVDIGGAVEQRDGEHDTDHPAVVCVHYNSGAALG